MHWVLPICIIFIVIKLKWIYTHIYRLCVCKALKMLLSIYSKQYISAIISTFQGRAYAQIIWFPVCLWFLTHTASTNQCELNIWLFKSLAPTFKELGSVRGVLSGESRVINNTLSLPRLHLPGLPLIYKVLKTLFASLSLDWNGIISFIYRKGPFQPLNTHGSMFDKSRVLSFLKLEHWARGPKVNYILTPKFWPQVPFGSTLLFVAPSKAPLLAAGFYLHGSLQYVIVRIPVGEIASQHFGNL